MTAFNSNSINAQADQRQLFLGSAKAFELQARVSSKGLSEIMDTIMEAHKKIEKIIRSNPGQLSVPMTLPKGNLQVAKKNIEAENNSSREVESYRKVAHDIRSPLSAMNMLKHVADWNKPEVRELISAAVSRINTIANDLMNPPKKEIKEDIAHNFAVDCAVTSIMKEKKAAFANENVRFNLSISPIALLVKGDVSSFQRALSNFINNSVDAMKEDGVSICVSVQEYEDRVLVQIADNGIGMSPETISKLGQLSFSIGSNKFRTGSGYGLGVKGSVELLTQMGGSVQFSSILGQGTTVTMSLKKA